MNVTLTDIFKAEMASLDIFKAHDLERFIERTKKGNPGGFATRIAIIGITVDDEIVACASNGEASCQLVWKGEDVTFTRAWFAPQDPSEMPKWLEGLFGGGDL